MTIITPSSKVLSIVLLLSFASTVFADAITISLGKGVSQWTLLGDRRMRPEAYRLAYVQDSSYSWSVSKQNSFSLDWEYALHQWNDPWLNKIKYGASFTPMFRYHIPYFKRHIFLGLGIGATYITDDKWMDRNLGSRFMFEDRFEVGLQYQQHHLSFSVNHYSNADLATYNDGVNVNYLNYRYIW